MIVIFVLLLLGSAARATTPTDTNPIEVLESVPEINWQRMHQQGKRLCATVHDRHSLAVVYTTQPQLLLAAHQALASYTSQLQRTYIHVRTSLLWPHPYAQEGRQLAEAMEVSLVRLQKQTGEFEVELSAFEAEFDGLVYGAKPFEPRRSDLIARCQTRFSRTETLLQQGHQMLFGEMRRVIPLLLSYDAHVPPPQP